MEVIESGRLGLRHDGKVCACGNICQDDIEEVEKLLLELVMLPALIKIMVYILYI